MSAGSEADRELAAKIVGMFESSCREAGIRASKPESIEGTIVYFTELIADHTQSAVAGMRAENERLKATNAMLVEKYANLINPPKEELE